MAIVNLNLQRLSPYSLNANIPLDGDMASPIERMFLGYVSHHQVYREIDCFVAVGTLAMCHVKKDKGSDLEPKVRWAVAIGQRGTSNSHGGYGCT